MDISNILKIFNNNNISLPFPISLPILDRGYVIINDKVAFKLALVSASINMNTPIIIYDQNNIEIGVLLFLKNTNMILNSLSEYQQVAAVIDADDVDDFITGKYLFKNDYLVIDHQYFEDYINYYFNSSSIWGGFIHEKQYVSSGISNRPINTLGHLVAARLSRFTEEYFETSVRAIAQPHSFERFLKLYHLLEVNYDYEIINEIQNLNIRLDLNKIGKLLWRQEREDFKRLLHILEKYCTNLTPIIDNLNQVKHHLPVAKKILFDFHKKDSSPVGENDFNKFEQVVNSSDGFSSSNCKKLSGTSNYDDFIIKLTSYIIYRTRSSIAHYKIGEYLMDSNDEKFICEFAEPLLKSTLLQCYK